MTNEKSGLKFFSEVLFRFRKTITFFIVAIGFFFFYNMFLIDHTLESLKFSLEQTALAYDVEDLAESY